MLIRNEQDKSQYSNVWVIAEVLSNKIQPVTHELIGAARLLANTRKSEVWAILLGNNVKEQALSLIPYGADKVIVVDDARLNYLSDEIETKILVRLILKYKPEIIICGATTRGRALIPRVAVFTDSGLTADCTELGIDPINGDFLQTRPAFGGNIMATIRCSNHRPQLATVRPRVMKVPEMELSRTGSLIIENVIQSDASKIKRILEVFHNTEASVNLADANIIISGGRGIMSQEGFRMLEKFAAKVGGAVGASRAAVDAGWIPYAHQVGQTGQTIQTKVYISCGISGQIQHLVGMQTCDYIIAIDKNPDTPMMQIADIAVVGDLFEIIPVMTDEINRL